MKNLSTTSSPHIRGKDSTSRIMLDVVIALLPALGVSIWAFGLRALLVCLVTIAACAAGELAVRLLLKKSMTLSDGSAIVTGLLLAMTLPATVPYWVAAMGGLFATFVVKGLFGGLGQNIFNPALAARAFLLLLWPASIVRYAAMGQSLPLFGSQVDIVAAATPLHHMQMPALPETSLLNMFLGNIPGSIGEISALALLIGFVYLVLRKVIAPFITLSYLGSVALVTVLFPQGQPALQWMLYSVLGGGVMLGAIFMATDYTTSPVSFKGQVFYGLGCGVLTVLFRYFGLFPEGVTYAILLMNALVWIIDRHCPPRRFGVQKGGAK